MGGSHLRHSLLFVALLVAGFVLVPASASATVIVTQDLSEGALSGSVALGINNLGDVVGDIDAMSGFSHAALWSDGAVLDLGTLGGDWSVAFGINDRGQIVGHSLVPQGDAHAFLWEAGSLTDLGGLGTGPSVAYDINNDGQAVGDCGVGWGWWITHACLWDANGIHDLGTLGGSWSTAVAINDEGEVVGTSETATGQADAFLWHDGSFTDLGNIGGFGSVASDVNNLGHVVGYSLRADWTWAPVMWKDGSILDLGQDGFEIAYGVNDLDQVVGYATVDFGGWSASRAAVWDAGELVTFGTLGGSFSQANAINNLGQIVGMSYVSNDVTVQAVAWRVVTSSSTSLPLADEVRAFVASGDVRAPAGRVLLETLESVTVRIDEGKGASAEALLSSFVHETQDFLSARKISQDAAERLISDAQSIIAELQGVL